jgi:hypothetical protein
MTKYLVYYIHSGSVFTNEYKTEIVSLEDTESVCPETFEEKILETYNRFNHNRMTVLSWSKIEMK